MSLRYVVENRPVDKAGLETLAYLARTVAIGDVVEFVGLNPRVVVVTRESSKRTHQREVFKNALGIEE